jgi:acetoin:2,6-dichlorophenolindophenol oxidoreductase subunit beta
MPVLTVNDAIAQSLAEEMRRDPRVLLMGAGAASLHPALVSEFGPERVRNAPLAEGVIVGAATGAAAMGLRPVVDLLFAPGLTASMDAIVNSAGKLRYLSGGQFQFPLVLMVRSGAGAGLGGQYNHNLEALFMHTPGLKVVMPSRVADFKGLLKSAIRDANPVLYFIDVALANHSDELPFGERIVPIGQAVRLREGIDVTLVSYGKTVAICLEAADQLLQRGVHCDVIDLRTLKPIDEDTVLASVRKTGRLVLVHEASRLCGVGAELAAIVGEKAFASLRAPVARLTGPDAPTAASSTLEHAAVPQPEAVRDAALRLLNSGLPAH